MGTSGRSPDPLSFTQHTVASSSFRVKPRRICFKKKSISYQVQQSLTSLVEHGSGKFSRGPISRVSIGHVIGRGWGWVPYSGKLSRVSQFGRFREENLRRTICMHGRGHWHRTCACVHVYARGLDSHIHHNQLINRSRRNESEPVNHGQDNRTWLSRLPGRLRSCC